jgi:hypothetical protein
MTRTELVKAINENARELVLAERARLRDWGNQELISTCARLASRDKELRQQWRDSMTTSEAR